MAMNTSQGNDTLLSEINVTPFVDIMLVLLIIFMVAAPLVQQQVDVELPETSSNQSIAVKENDVVLIVDKNKQLLLANTKLTMTELSQKLKSIMKNKKEKVVYLQADKSVPYGFVVKIMALVKNSGVDKMGMITNQESDASSGEK